jgi:hypothetical protein
LYDVTDRHPSKFALDISAIVADITAMPAKTKRDLIAREDGELDTPSRTKRLRIEEFHAAANNENPDCVLSPTQIERQELPEDGEEEEDEEAPIETAPVVDDLYLDTVLPTPQRSI